MPNTSIMTTHPDIIKHTPLPWKIGVLPTLKDGTEELHIVTDDKIERFVAKINCYIHITKEDMDNAKYIARAANTFEQLFDEMRNIKSLLDYTEENFVGNAMTTPFTNVLKQIEERVDIALKAVKDHDKRQG